MNHPKISIITVNYKQPSVTCELLDSIAELTYPNLETIVVDNAQEYDDSFLYRYHLNDVKVINVKENVGFAGGNNIGIENATGDYVFLLNNDTVINNGVIEGLLEVFNSDEKIGAVSPILRYHEAPDKIQFAGFTEINPVTGRNELIQKKPDQEVIDTPYFHGAAVMIPMEVIDKCGLMPEEYFLYYEELEWSRCLARKGYQIKVAANLEVFHKESVTTGKNSPLKVYYQNRNRVHFMRNSQSSFRPFLMFFLLFSVPKNLITHFIKREKDHLKALIKATKDGLFNPKFGQQPII